MHADRNPVPAAWTFGPFAAGLAPAERVARLRCLRAIVQLHAGPRGTAAARALHAAEEDAEAAPLAVAALDRLDALDRRHILASYAKVARSP